MTEITALSKYIRVSPKKVRLVAKAVKGLKLEAALGQLAFLPKAAAKPLLQTLESAVANAENNLKITKDKLQIKKIEIGGGPALKRFRAVSRGAAHQYKRRMSHIKVVLEEVVSGPKNQP